MNKEITDEEFYSIQDTEELVDMCLAKDHNIKIYKQQLDQANKKLETYKELIEHIKGLVGLGEKRADYDYEENLYDTFEPFDFEYYINNWFELREIEESDK